MKVPSNCGNHNIAILDPDPAVMEYVRRVLEERYSVSAFTEAREFLHGLGESPSPDLLLMDWHIAEDGAEENALGLLARIHAARPSLPIILFACTFGLNDAVAATRLGVARIILKPFKSEDIEHSVQQCLNERGRQLADDDINEIPLDENTSFVRASKRMREIESQCTLVARADIPVLILGESGTGKEVAAMLIHKMSARSQRSFLKVNCAAMPADLLESELFGYEQGAFTGAVKSKPGKFEICNGGTILLDEIGEMPTSLQVKLLQVLQDGTFARLGGRSTVKVNVRVIAATNIDMKAAISQKTFREDLFYRLNGFTLNMPPLRERIEEVPILSQHFMRKVAAKYDCNPLPISPALMRALSSHPWPGNLRELENVIKRYLVLGGEKAIIDELSPWQSTTSFVPFAEDAGVNAGLKHLVRNLKGGAESAAIAQTLEGTGWNRKAAASDLQISYKALLYKIKQYNLSPPNKRQAFNQAQSA
ncbi:MAG: sigma-54-dependent transcriptional regulator [Terracidiphilus sp.]